MILNEYKYELGTIEEGITTDRYISISVIIL